MKNSFETGYDDGRALREPFTPPGFDAITYNDGFLAGLQDAMLRMKYVGDLIRKRVEDAKVENESGGAL